MANRKTTLNQLVVGSPFTNQGAWDISIAFGATGVTGLVAGATGATAVTNLNLISAYDVYEVLGTTAGFTAGDLITIEGVNYSSGTGTVVTVDATGWAGTVTARAVSLADTEINYFAAGGTKESTTVTSLYQVQSSVVVNGTGFTGVNYIEDGDAVALSRYLTAVNLDVTIQVNDIYTVNANTGAETRGSYALNLALYEPNGGDFYTVATLEIGDAITVSGLATQVISPGTGATAYVSDLVIYNNSGEDLLVDLTASVSKL